MNEEMKQRAILFMCVVNYEFSSHILGTIKRIILQFTEFLKK